LPFCPLGAGGACSLHATTSRTQHQRAANLAVLAGAEAEKLQLREQMEALQQQREGLDSALKVGVGAGRVEGSSSRGRAVQDSTLKVGLFVGRV
jgi:hypothetical protein